MSENQNTYKLKGKKSVPVILQMEAVECGAASLAMVLAHYGCWVSLEELRLECGVSRDGSRASGIVKAARGYGMEAKGFREQVETLGKHPLPMILFWNFNHFVVLIGVKGDNFLINDPGTGFREVSKEEFDESFTGVVLTFKPKEGFKKSKRQDNLFKGLYQRLRGSKSAIFYAVLAGLLLVLPTLMIPTFQRIFLDQILLGDYRHWLNPLCSVMLVTMVMLFALNWLQAYVLLKTNLKLALVTSAEFLQHALCLPILFFQQRFPGELQNRLSLNDGIAVLLSNGLAANLLNLVMIGFYAVVMVHYDGVLAAITVSIAAMNFIALKYANKKRLLLSQSLQQDEGKLVAYSMSGLQLVETIKATGGEDEYFSGWSGYFAKVLNGQQRLAFNNVLLQSLPECLVMLNTVIILVVGSMRIIHGDMTIGVLLAYQAVVALFLAPVSSLLELGTQMQEVQVSLARLDDIHNYPAELEFSSQNKESIDALSESRLSGELILKGLSFGYNRTMPALISDFDLYLAPGKRIALVGGSGSGKSTIAKLIAGLYQPWGGEILFDGKPRDEWPRELMLCSFASVDQEIFLFEGTVSENISMWDPHVGMEEVTKAAKDACIHKEIAGRTGGYFSPVHEGGRNFSGGQRQRLEIARALLKSPSLLILDEATSALDPGTEKAIDENIRKRGCACIIVAHRLSTIRDCDEILVLDRGKVVERGTHSELVNLKQHYYRLISED